MKPKSVSSLKRKDKPTKAKLFKVFDELRRKYIRERDTDWKGWEYCISCFVYRPVKELQVGHYYKRQHDFQTELAGEERNTNLQCVPCNGIKRGNPHGYAVGLIGKYGQDIIVKLAAKKKVKKFWRYNEVEELIEEYKSKLKEL